MPDPADTARLYGPLVDRIAQDAVYVQAEYSSTQAGGTVGGKAGGGVKFGLSLTGAGSERQLVEALTQDLARPGTGLVPLSTCGR